MEQLSEKNKLILKAIAYLIAGILLFLSGLDLIQHKFMPVVITLVACGFFVAGLYYSGFLRRIIALLPSKK